MRKRGGDEINITCLIKMSESESHAGLLSTWVFRRLFWQDKLLEIAGMCPVFQPCSVAACPALDSSVLCEHVATPGQLPDVCCRREWAHSRHYTELTFLNVVRLMQVKLVFCNWRHVVNTLRNHHLVWFSVSYIHRRTVFLNVMRNSSAVA